MCQWKAAQPLVPNIRRYLLEKKKKCSDLTEQSSEISTDLNFEGFDFGLKGY